MMWTMLSTMLVILALGVGVLFLLKKVRPKRRRAAGKKISVLETVYLEPRKAVHLLQVGSMKLLVASSSEGLTKLDNVTEAFPPDYDEVARRVAGTDEDREGAEEASP